MTDVLLEIDHLSVEFKTPRGRLRAVADVSFDVRRGETLGLVGESGCGKSTTARAVMMLERPSAGTVRFDGADLATLSDRDLRRRRRRFQMVFQDPRASLNARRRVKDILAEGLAINRVPGPWEERIDEILHAVGLDPAAIADRRSFELSGGQCQRVAIARALLLDPQLIVCDEVVSALDVSIQAQILNLLEDMKEQFGLTLLFIAHDLAVVRSISDRVAVMYLGRICEVAPADELYGHPRHPYTRALLSAIPDPQSTVVAGEMLVGGELPSPYDPPTGCRFRTRCPRAEAICASEEPDLRSMGVDHEVACHFPAPSGRRADA